MCYNLSVSRSEIAEKIERICRLLETEYGRPECKAENPPLDELVLTILSQTTTAANYTRAFSRLRDSFQDWDAVRNAPVGQVEDAIRCGGLAKVKAQRIQMLLQEIYCIRGSLSLDFLSEMGNESARDYLMQFHGVGIKTASCVLLFSMNRPVFPVDTHVHRLSQHLGLIGRDVDANEAHRVLGALVRDQDVHSLHVNLVTHGRRVCKARNQACDDCVLLEECPRGQKSGGI